MKSFLHFIPTFLLNFLYIPPWHFYACFSLTHVKGVLVPHDVDLIILLAVGFGVALIFGYIAARLRLPSYRLFNCRNYY